VLFLGRQGDLVFHSARPVADKLGVHVLQQGGHRRVVGGDQRGETADAFLTGTVGQLSQQFGAQSPALPVVDDGDGDLGGLGVFGVPDIAGDAYAAPVGVIQRTERLVVVVVDVGEVAQLRRGQFLLFVRNRIWRDASLSRAKPSASSGASALRTCRISTADPSRSTTVLPLAAGRR